MVGFGNPACGRKEAGLPKPGMRPGWLEGLGAMFLRGIMMPEPGRPVLIRTPFVCWFRWPISWLLNPGEVVKP